MGESRRGLAQWRARHLRKKAPRPRKTPYVTYEKRTSAAWHIFYNTRVRKGQDIPKDTPVRLVLRTRSGRRGEYAPTGLWTTQTNILVFKRC